MSFALREQLRWSHSNSSILAAVCVVVGLVNIWRFPALMAEHGGYTFMGAYVLAQLTFAFPLLLLQWRLGRHFRGTVQHCLAQLGNARSVFSVWHLAGGMMSVACALMALIYLVIGGVVLAYQFQAATGDLASLTYTGAIARLDALSADPWALIGWSTILLAMLYVISGRGLVQGIERTLPTLTGALFIVLGGLVAYALSMDVLKVSWAYVFAHESVEITPRLFVDAYTLAFYSLALGTGIHFILGSYCSLVGADISMVCKIIGADVLMGVLATVLVVPVAVGAELELSSGFALIFQTLPIAFQSLGIGQFFLALFYLLMVLVILSSLLFLIEPGVLWLQTSLGWNRRAAVSSVLLSMWGLSVLTLQQLNGGAEIAGTSISWFSLLQFLVSSMLLPAAMLLVIILFAFVARTDRLALAMQWPVDSMRLRIFVWWLAAVVLPVMIGVQVVGMAGLYTHLCFVDIGLSGSICEGTVTAP